MGTRKGGIMENVGKWREENMGIEWKKQGKIS